jgi:hypothetical protein
MRDHHHSCVRLQFWDANEYECPCTCPPGWPRAARSQTNSIPFFYSNGKLYTVTASAKCVNEE